MSKKRPSRQALALLLALLLLLSLPALSAGAEEALEPGVELLDNGDFSGPLKFQLYTESGGEADQISPTGSSGWTWPPWT